MVFKRVWDASCPRVWDQWEADGSSWVIQDLDPQDYEEATDILLEEFCSDETLCIADGIAEDAESMKSLRDYWLETFSEQRLGLACYVETNGIKTLVGLNACIAKCADDKDDYEPKGDAWKHMLSTLKYIESKLNILDYLGTDTVLYGIGLVIKREYRGFKLGGKVISAREPLCRALGIKASATLFTGIASQKLAQRCGFTTIVAVTFDELADVVHKYPKGDYRALKMMAKKYY